MFKWLPSFLKKIIPTKETAKVIPFPKKITMTAEILQNICPTLNTVRAEELSDLMNELFPKYGLTSITPYRMFVANVAQESGEFSHKSENMRYTTASRIRAVWPSRFPTMESAQPYVNNPIGLANLVYGGRMGNTAPNDGWLYRGGAFIGLTGKEMYSKYAAYIEKQVDETAALVRNQYRYALDSALWFFCIHKKLIQVAETGDFKKVVKGINGGYIGLNVREQYYDRCIKFIV